MVATQSAEGVPLALQPAPYMLLQLRDGLPPHVAELPVTAWCERPAGATSFAFHLRHITGVLDRMATYERGEMLNDAQKVVLEAEGEALVDDDSASLLAHVDAQIVASLATLCATYPTTLGDVRGIGRRASRHLARVAHARCRAWHASSRPTHRHGIDGRYATRS